ncbi:hypothetical protein CesoFtcFv8_017123 [Champsocephalus esox]|uniref:Glutaminyl-peptide cyclotransferase n=1 Tax=Champsocephalus esox TaxID=159716 RepID=A0AAN8BJ88_9TELE|nr:hypothetical protein CesoFtcFv8_017123 [Champsocephalus esox]
MWRGATTAMVDRSLGPSKMRLFYTVAIWVTLIHCTDGIPWTEEKLHHRAFTLTRAEISTAVSHTDLEQMWQRDLRPLLVTRYPGSAGSTAVQEHIKTVLAGLGAGWEPPASWSWPATTTPSTTPPQWHGRAFQGATDSAVPCAMMLELARALDEELKAQKSSSADLTLQLLFFDGEEALFQWTPTDSIYGSRHLAEKMEATPHPAGATDTNQLDGMDLLVLLDLIGGPSPSFGNQFPSTSHWLSRLQSIEKRLHSMNQLVDHPDSVQYFWPNIPVGHVQDDHIPFLNRGVRVLHLIPSPFPSVWHTFDDNEQNLDRSTIQNLNKIIQVFVLEYLNARPAVPSNPQNVP